MFRNMLKRYQGIPVQVRASFWFLICAFFQKGISFITTPIFTRLLTTAEYGQYNIFNSWLGILTVFVSLNLYCGVYSRGLVKFEKDRDAFASSLQGLSLTLVAGWSVIYFAFHVFWNQLFSLTTTQMIFMFVLIWGTNAFGFWSMGERVDFKYKKLVAVTMAMSLAKPILGIILVKMAKDKVTARIFGLAFVDAVVCAGLFADQMRKGRRFYSAKYWKHALVFNIPLIPHYLSSTVLNSADRIMIGKMVGESSAGIYSLAYSISLIMTMFNTALGQTLEPWLFKKINAKQIEDISRVAYPALILIAMVNLLLIALAPEVVAIFAPVEYYDAIWIIPPVAMSAFFMFSYFLFSGFEFYFERTKLIAVATSTGAVLNIILNYIFIRLFGYYAAGYTTLFCYMVYAAFHFICMRKICREQMDGKQPYSTRVYSMIMVAFLCGGFLFLLTYSRLAIRYGLLGSMIIVIIMLRKRIIEEVQRIQSVRKNSQ